jgi:hypothetical protein
MQDRLDRAPKSMRVRRATAIFANMTIDSSDGSIF